MFAKHLKEVDIPGLVDTAERLGIDGYEWPVRPGYVVNPDNVATALGELCAALRSVGKSIPACACDTRFVDPDAPFVEPMLGAMAENGVQLLKLGYFLFDPDRDDYWQLVDHARRVLAKWAKLARKHNVTVCYHTHSSPEIGSSAAELMHLIKGFDPDHIGGYLDTGHLAVGGERFPVACAMVGDYLKMAAFKDARKVWVETDGGRAIKMQTCPMGDGVADIPEALRHLRTIGFDGPVVVHVEYEMESPQALFESSLRDVRICKAELNLGA
jgi:sugar phosphate isomerase/epimerase